MSTHSLGGGTGGASVTAGGTGGTKVLAVLGGAGGVGGGPSSGGGMSGGAGGAVPDCRSLIGVVHDFNSLSATSFSDPHPDFEAFLGGGITSGLVNPTLGANGAPEYADPQPAGTPLLTGRNEFARWYSTAHPANATILLDLDDAPSSAGITRTLDAATGVTTYESTHFFPIDGRGSQAEDATHTDANGTPHNYHFTFELNTEFIYTPGQVFSFFGNDDVWVFIDKKLAIDLGGVHPSETGSVALDTLGLIVGRSYGLSLFYAQRHTPSSTFKLATNIAFTNCYALRR